MWQLLVWDWLGNLCPGGENPKCALFATIIVYCEKDLSQNVAKVTFKMELFFFY